MSEMVFAYAPANEKGERTGDYVDAVDEVAANDGCDNPPHGYGFVRRTRMSGSSVLGAAYDFGGGYAPTEESAVDLLRAFRAAWKDEP